MSEVPVTIRIKADKHCNAITVCVDPLPQVSNHRFEHDSDNINFDIGDDGMIDYMYIYSPSEEDLEKIESMKSVIPYDMYNTLRIFYGRKR